jgi:hypothetical protein
MALLFMRSIYCLAWISVLAVTKPHVAADPAGASLCNPRVFEGWLLSCDHWKS